MADQNESIKRQHLIQRAILLALGGVATGTAVAIPTEGDGQSPIHLDCITVGSRGRLRGLNAWTQQPLPCPPFLNFPVNYVFVETAPPQLLNGVPTFLVPNGMKPFAYYQFTLPPSQKAFSVGDRVSHYEAFQIPATDLDQDDPSLYIVFCTNITNPQSPAPKWCPPTAKPKKKKPIP